MVWATGCAPWRGAGDPGDPGDPPPPAPAERAPEEPVKAAPRWVRVANLAGPGDQRTAGFDIAGAALQWRVTVTCQEGRVRVGVDGDREALVDQACPGRFFGFSIRTGHQPLEVRATGPWEAVVDQQVDEPIAEPLLPGMTARTRVARGAFSGVEQDGRGTAALYSLPDGRLGLRLDDFFVTANDDLFVWASEAAAPRTSADALYAPHVQLEALKATAGSQNYLLPESLDLDRVHSIVIWCEPVRTAYAAAPLLRR